MAGEPRARRDAVLHARAVLPRRPHRPVRRGASSRRASRAWSRRPRIRIRSCAAAGSRTCGRTASRVDVGARRGGGGALNQPFFTLMREHRPFVILKAATSLDGRIAAAPGRRTRLTSAAANRHAHRVRAEVDAIGVGVGTILVDDPLLTARGAYRERPLTRVIFDRRLRTPPTARVLSTREAGPVIIVTTAAGAARAERAPAARGARGRDRSRPRRHVRARRSSASARAASDRCCSKAAPRCTRRRGTKASSISSGCTSRRTCSGRAACRCSTGGDVFVGDAGRAARRAARPGCADRGICSRASLKRSASWSSASRRAAGSGCGSRSALARELAPGDSLAVNGVCLTVILAEDGEVHADVGPETLRVTTLGALATGQPREPRAAAARGRPVRRAFRAGTRRRDRPRRGAAAPKPTSTG